MENEIVYVNPQKTQVIYQYFRYQRASKNSEIYRCVKRTCGATLKPEPRIRNIIEHPEESHCETECLNAFKNLTRNLEENSDLNPPELYRKAYERLAKTYSHKELSQFWKPYSKLRNVIAHHVRKNKPKIPKETKEIKIEDTIYDSIFDEKFLLFDNHNDNNRILIFMSPIGISNKEKEEPNTNKMESNIISGDIFLALQAQIHCYKFFILKEIPVQDNLLTSLQQLTLKLTRQEDEVQFIKTVEYTNYERPQKSMELLFIQPNQHLDNLHVSAFQDFISARYPLINGFLSPDIYLLDRPMFNPDVMLENIFIQVAHAENHWVTISNYNPNFKSNEFNCCIF